jgi:hypothetical protein
MSFEINSHETRMLAHQKATELRHENPRAALDYVGGLEATDSWRWA